MFLNQHEEVTKRIASFGKPIMPGGTDPFTCPQMPFTKSVSNFIGTANISQVDVP
jgi:hypothetical protein